MSTRPIRFFHRGQVVEVNDVHPTKSVLDWLREDAHCSGTKEGCNEGDCGACTVVVGEAKEGEQLELRAVNACIQFLPTLDGKALFTVEDLARDGELHPVQQAMVDCHGSQCGFCTPGFVMSMWAQYETRPQCPTRREWGDALSGNLCRCTGYRPILDAGEQAYELPPARMDTKPVLAALAQLAGDAPLHYEATHPLLPGAPRHAFHAPRTLDELAALVEQHPQARLLAGSTDIALWVNKQLKALAELIYLGEVAELKTIESRADGGLVIGAGASLESAWSALSARHPALREMHLRFASLPIRHAGTMGGNVANGSPIGDAAPVLLALDAQLLLRRGAQQRRLPLTAFYLDYMKNALLPGEFVQAIELPPPPAGLKLAAYKLSKRYDCDISAVAAGLAIQIDGEGLVHQVRLAFGGMAATVKRAAAAEAAVVGRPWTEATLRAAQAALERDYTPLTDMRASAAHRLRSACNLLERFWLETRVAAPLAASELSVWSS
jgi:xanthine dehydrogenase small subunit